MPSEDFAIFLGLCAAMGLSIFLALPLIALKRMRGRTIEFLTAGAIGILVFLLADIFGDVGPLLAGTAAYFTDPWLDAIFVAAAGGMFAVLYAIDQRGPPPEAPDPSASAGAEARRPANPARLAAIIALAMGLQNVTEGLFFGANWSDGSLGLLTVTFVGFFLQNFTEGFPIVSPFLGTPFRRWGYLAALFVLGGGPTVLGGAVGYFYTSVPAIVLFDALAIGAILYSILPMLKFALRTEGTRRASYYRIRLIYFGVLAGFLVGFVVNAF
ncbi:MAG: hypothetical protein QXG65_05870 [Thermoplasmata archaeon]